MPSLPSLPGTTRRFRRIALTMLIGSALAAAGALPAPAGAQSAPPRVTSPREQFGHEIGADYRLPDYTQFLAYWEKLARESDRMLLDTIGTTAEGRPQVMAIITSPENHRRLDRYKEIARRLALAEGLTDSTARALAREGKGVVWIDGGLHATEVLGAQQLIETVHQLVSRSDPETMRFLDDLIILAVHANPDGMELVSDWYMRTPDSLARRSGDIPRLYQKYIGHDNNRDFYMSAQPESRNMNRVLYREWFPQIMYNHHQTGPAGTVMFAPPFRDPFNYNFDPLVPIQLDLVGAAMHARFLAEDKPGVTMRSGANYSTWWNGGLRTTAYFHNMIGLLTETIGNPTPIDIPLVPRNQLPRGDLPAPIAPQRWRFRQSVDYSVTANKAVLDVASRHREQFLFNIYRMGMNSVERGSRDTWTVTPRDVDALVAAAAAASAAAGSGDRAAGSGDLSLNTAPFGRGVSPALYEQVLRDPAQRDPRAYILSVDQPDFPTATKFVNALLFNGITVHRASADFTVGGKRYPRGSFVVKTAQAFRPFVLDMFEPQDHPNDFAYPGGPPRPPYDVAGWTLAYQMGIQFDRVLEDLEAPLQPITDEPPIRPPSGTVRGAPRPTGYLLSHVPNDAAAAVNRLLGTNERVYWLRQPVTIDGASYAAGTFYVPAGGATRGKLDRLAADLGVDFVGITARPAGDALQLRPARIGLWDRYGGSMPSGWIRWILEQYGFAYEVVYPQTLDAGNLTRRYDVLIFPDGAIPGTGADTGGGGGGFGRQPSPEEIPAEYRNRLGHVTGATTVPQIRRFLEQGGTVITIGTSANLAYHLGLPVRSALVDSAAGANRPLPREKYFIPGSVLAVRVDSAHPLAAGIGDSVDVFFDDSPVFRLAPDAASKGVRRVAWFDSAKPLRSGWAWGQQYLENGAAVIEADVGRGRLLLFGPEIAFRAQPHGTFKFLFNGILRGAAAPAAPR